MVNEYVVSVALKIKMINVSDFELCEIQFPKALFRHKSTKPFEKFLELAGSASLSHEIAFPEEKRDLLKIVTSNREVDGKRVDLKPSLPFLEVANRFQNSNGAPYRDVPRTWNALLAKLKLFFSSNHAPGWNLGDRT